MAIDEHPLPAGSSVASRARYEAACRLAGAFPPGWGGELALTGSASRGWADDDSDIEFVAWMSEVPSADDRRAWRESVGIVDAAADPHTSVDGTVWEWSKYEDFWLETGWQSVRRHEDVLRSIIEGRTTDHRVVTLADAVTLAVPLRTSGLLARWQDQLRTYPDEVQQALVQAGARRWQYRPSYWGLARRGDRVAVEERLLADVQSIMRIVFALNRVWEPAWKWSARRIEGLAIQPPMLLQRIDEALSLPGLEERCDACANLFADALALVPDRIDVSLPRSTIRESLRERAP
jgi:hypothetical protein